MSVNNSIFKGDDFKLKFQMLHLGMDVLFVIWSTTIGKIMSGHSLDSCFFFLVIFPFVASPFILSFFWKVFICSAKGDTPLDPVFFFLLLSFLCLKACFSSLLFSCFLFFTWNSILFCFSIERKMFFFAFCIYIQVVHIWTKHVLAKRGEYASAYGVELRSAFLPSSAVQTPRCARP